MNFIYIHTHDTGCILSPYGYKVHTPNIEKFAHESVMFKNAFCTGPTCSPSRAGLLTGTMPHSNGMLGLAHLGFELNDYDKHLSNFLRKNGYETALCGVQHETTDSSKLGYDHYYKLKSSKDIFHDTIKTDLHHAKWVAEFINKKHGKPFFLSFGMENTHRPFPLEDNIDEYLKLPSGLPETKESLEDFNNFHKSLKTVDDCVEIVLNAVENAGISDETVIVFTTDHGIAFPTMKCNLTDSGMKVLLFIKHPNYHMGEVCNQLVSHLDIYPTICDILNIEKPGFLQGKSLVPILEDTNNKINDEIFSQINFHCAYQPTRCVRTDKYKLIKRFDNKFQRLPVNTDDSPTKDVFLDAGYYNMDDDEIELFDLTIDPEEKVNLKNNSNYKNVLDDMLNRLNKFMLKTNDPLLHNTIKRPKNAQVFVSSAISPSKDRIFEK